MPKKVKVKLGGHGEIGRWSKRVSDFITRAGAADKLQGAKMRKIRILRALRARSMHLHQNQAVPPTVILSIRSVG
jgi:hypothetical protein